MNLDNFIRVARYDLPVPDEGSTNDLALEVSALTYNSDTGTLFLLGDEGTSIVQVSTTGVLIDTMALPAGMVADPEGLTYIGNGEFVLVEERTRIAISFTYEGGTTLDAGAVQEVDLGTDVGNIGLEGIAYDPLTGGFVLVKETGPQGVFTTTIDFDGGTASNGSSTTVDAVNLFDPALLGALDLADVFALSALTSTDGTDDEDNILILSQESAVIYEVNRDGSIVSQLTLVGDADNALSISGQGHEGLAMDNDGYLYVVSEQGGGANTPQLWVYQLATFENAAPTGIVLDNAVTELAENTSTTSRLKLADVTLTDDGIGDNSFVVSGADAAYFEADSTGLYLKAGTALDFETKTSYSVTVSVDDTSVGATPDASTDFTLSVANVVNENPASAAFISEVAPWSSGSSQVAADWFELSNTGASALDISGWKMDDSSASFATSAALTGVTSIAAGQSVIFFETSAANFETVKANFIAVWFDGVAPAGLQFGYYSGSGIGLSTSGDAVTLFDAAGTQQAKVTFGASASASPYATFENSAAQDGAALTSLSEDGVAGAFTVDGIAGGTETGSPGTVGKVFVSEAAPWSSGNSSSPVAADWFELSNTTSAAVSIAGWRFDDDSVSFAESDPLVGVTSLASGESAIFLNTNAAGFDAARTAFINTWFDGTAPDGLQFGYYEGAGLGTGGDQVNIFDSAGNLITGLIFGAATAAPALATFDNAAGTEFALVTTLSSPGTNGAVQITNSFGNTETGSPGSLETGAVAVNEPPSAVGLGNAITALAEGTNTPVRVKLADVAITDDGNGFNALSLSGADAALFEVDASGLYLKAFTQLDFETKASYEVTVEVSDPTLPGAPQATVNYVLTVENVAVETPGIAITEVAPWSSGDSPVGEDWFEVTNFGSTAIDLTGWKFDDDSASLVDADPLLGVTSIAAGQSVIFLNTDAANFAAVQSAFVDTWYNGTAPAGLTFGYYDGAGLGTGGDSVVLFDGAGTVQASIAVGASPEAAPFATFDNSAGADNVRVETTSVVGTNGAFNALSAADETGSPGLVATPIDPPMVKRGGDADETLTGGSGGDRVYGAGGTDSLAGLDGDDFLFGQAGDDDLDGGLGDDRLYGGSDADVLNAGDGDDVIYGDNSGGGDSEGFADLFVFDSDDGSDKVFDFEAGLDQIVLVDGSEYTLSYKRGTTTLTYGDTVVKFVNEIVTDADIIFTA